MYPDALLALRPLHAREPALQAAAAPLFWVQNGTAQPGPYAALLNSIALGVNSTMGEEWQFVQPRSRMRTTTRAHGSGGHGKAAEGGDMADVAFVDACQATAIGGASGQMSTNIICRHGLNQTAQRQAYCDRRGGV